LLTRQNAKPHRAVSQFDVSSIIDIKLLKPYQKNLTKPLNRLGIPEKQFYRAADVAQLLHCSTALVVCRFPYRKIQVATSN
jgi:hypothetical protein